MHRSRPAGARPAGSGAPGPSFQPAGNHVQGIALFVSALGPSVLAYHAGPAISFCRHMSPPNGDDDGGDDAVIAAG
jgi:hypothetical protein